MYGTIYKITNLVNGKVYIGQTTYCNILQRWASHRTASKSIDTLLGRAIRKYGEENFRFSSVMRYIDREHLDRAEGMCIRLYRATDPTYGYNLKGCGNGHKHSDITKQQMSLTRLNNPLHGAWLIGRKDSEETKLNKSKAQKRIGNKPPTFYNPVIVNDFIYPSLKHASRMLNIHYSTLMHRLKFKGKTKLSRRHQVTVEYLIKESS